VVFIPKKRKKRIFVVLRQHLGAIFRELAKHKEVEVVEGHLMSDHVHMCLSIPPKYALSNVVGYIKGKSAITIARKYGGRARNFIGEVFWARGCFVSTVGLDEEMVRAYIRTQEQEDERYDQMKLGVWPPWVAHGFIGPFEGLTCNRAQVNYAALEIHLLQRG
jgi:putative transposase